ncbi:MAG TPA: PilW family protein [Burkholderiales bacterium]
MFAKTNTMRFDLPRPGRQDGLSLVELMVAITISLLLMVAASGAFLSTSQSNREVQAAGQQIENGRYGMSAVQDDLRHAGFYGQYYQISPGTITPDPCVVALAAIKDSLPIPVQGYNDSGGSPVSCIPGSDFVPGTDVLVVRRAQAIPLGGPTTPRPDDDAPVPGDIYIQSVPASADIQIGGGGYTFDVTKADGTATVLKRKDGVKAAEIRKFNVHVYFISPCSGTSCDGGGDGVPTLKRLELISIGGAPGFRVVPLAEGIENMQLEYGIDDQPVFPVPNPFTGQTVGDGVPDRYVAAPTAADWSNVVTVKVYMLARNTEQSQGYTDAKTYDLGLAGTVTPGGSFKRHLFTSTTQIRNVSQRRES